MKGRSAVSHTVFLSLVGAAGWAAVAWAAGSGIAWPGLRAAALFFGVAIGARALAFRLAGARVSLDSAFFVAAAVCLGPRAVGLAIGVTLAVDSLVREWREKRIFAPLYALYFGGISGGLVCGVARLYGIEAGVGRESTAGVVAAVGGTFVAAHYAVQAVQARLHGERWGEAIARGVVGVLAEGTLLPLAITIALIWDPARPLPTALLGGTYLLVNLVFNRLAKAKAALDRRVGELETINRSARALARTLDEEEQAQAVCLETARALPAADRVELALLDGEGRLSQHVWLKRRGGVEHHAGGRAEAERLARVELALDREVRDPGRPSVRAEIVVPMRRYGEALGVLRIESRVGDGLGEDELRIAEAIAGQATAAVENARLYALATVDGLTKLYVRRYFDARLEEEIERSRRFGATFSLILLDIDNFKRLNDTYGHQAGDRALREVARRASGQLRGVDLAGRYGGEEIGIILPRTALALAVPVAERIRMAIADQPLKHEGQGLAITASLGITGYVEGDSAAAMIARADEAMYRAKAAGKNRVEVSVAVVPVGVVPRESLRA